MSSTDIQVFKIIGRVSSVGNSPVWC